MTKKLIKKSVMDKVWNKHTKKDIDCILSHGSVAIAGLGGIGSNTAIMLARAGVGKLFLVDFDIVDQSNLNRQGYNLNHIGMKKTMALKEQLLLINPTIKISYCDIKLEEDNCKKVFEDYIVICEALDNAADKAMLVSAIANGEKTVIATSGMAGYGNVNNIKTIKRFSNLYVCGDMVSGIEDDDILISSRVMACAAHQANTAIRVLLGMDER